MSRPDPRQQQAVAMSAAFAGAVDLSALKNRAAPTAGPGAGSAPAPGSPAGAQAGGQEASPFVVDVDEATFGGLVQASAQLPVVINLEAAWAEPSLALGAALSNLAAASGGTWILGRVDVDANPQIAQAFQVQTLPMAILLVQGRPAAEVPLTTSEPELRQWFTQVLDQLRPALPGIAQAEARLAAENGDAAEPEPDDPRFVAAEDALARGDYAAATLAYQQILAAEPGNTEAKAALAQTGLLARVDELPADAIARADAAPDDVELQKGAADAQVAAGDAAAAFARLIATVRRTAGDERTAAREHLIELFGLFATDDPEVIKARRALAAALY
ncbi:tetratricopeptide repeat protein [Nakamurella sp.]|uniref:tetratricopeptide repeat protein n=1 Tax=Nakamurella sp. TaxID=1869182 RepID=UPI0037833A24